MKKLLILALFSIFIAGCSNSNNSAKTVQPVQIAASEYAELSDDLYSFEFKLDGVKYTLPADYSEFEKNGWVLDEKDNVTGPATGLYTTNEIDLRKDDKKISVGFLNAGISGAKLSDCKVCSVSSYSDKNSLILPKGIAINTSIDDLKAAYGEPAETDSYDDSSLKDEKIFKYYAADNGADNDIRRSFWISVDTKDNLVSSISFTDAAY